MIIKHLSTVYIRVYKSACSSLQAGARFLLPLEHMAQIPRCSAASHLLGKTEAALIPGLCESGGVAGHVPVIQRHISAPVECSISFP